MSDRNGKQESHFAHKIVRLMWKTHAAIDIKLSGIAVVSFVAHAQDAIHYSGPARIWRKEFLAALDLRDGKNFAVIVRRCVDAGWLGTRKENNRAIAHYWSRVPPGIDPELDRLIRMSEGPIQGVDPGYGDPIQGVDPGYGDPIQGVDPGNDPAYHPASSNPCPSPKRRGSCTRARRLSFSDEDRKTADFIFDKIRELSPGHKSPNLDQWANVVRLMRQKDGRSDSEIRSLFAWANADDFWCKNILSPDRLRRQWDKLTIQRNGKPNRTAPAAQPPPPIRRKAK